MNCFDALNNNIENPYQRYWVISSSNELIKEAILKVPTTKKIEELIIYGQTEFNYDDSFLLEEINTNERSFLTLLLHSGYITNIKNNIYKIPNLEVKSYFFDKILPSLLDKHYPNQESNLLLTTFESVQEYGKAFQQKIIDKNIHLNYYEFFFQTTTIAPFIKLSSRGVKHKIDIEQRTDEGNKIDVLLTPLNELPDSEPSIISNSVYILELKRTEFPGSKNRLIKEALIQVFSKKYIGYVLKNAELPENKHWKSFHIRATVFSLNKKMDKWIITIKELKFSLEKLKAACKICEDNKHKKDELLELILSLAISVSEYKSED